MNLTETCEGSSRKGQENGDVSNEVDRPLKKARFAWQVKGKYHLKNDSKDRLKESSTTSPNPPVIESSDIVSSNNDNSADRDIDSFGNFHINPMDCVIGTPEEQLSPCSSINISPEKLSYPRYVSKYEQNVPIIGLRRNSESFDNLKCVPPSMVVSQRFMEDECISRWQAQQMVKGMFDNTINRVLDLWIEAPPPPAVRRSQSVALDVADYINNHPGDENVENEGILMAISAHGLQHPPNANFDDVIDNTEDCYTLRIPSDEESHEPIVSNSRQSERMPSDDESHEPTVTNSNQCDTDTSSEFGMSWTYSDEPNNIFHLFPDTTSMSENLLNSSAQCDLHTNPGQDQHDLLDEAITFAIQNKGLTTFDSEYG